MQHNTDSIFHKPKTVIAARNLFYTSIFLGVINVILRDISLGFKNAGNFLGMSLTVVGLALILFLIKEVGQRKNWARIILLVFVLAKLMTMRNLFNPEQKTTILEITLFIINIVLQMAALIFLFRKETNEWFKVKQS